MEMSENQISDILDAVSKLLEFNKGVDLLVVSKNLKMIDGESWACGEFIKTIIDIMDDN